MDPGYTPTWVFPVHPPDQITQAAIDLRPPCPISQFPMPEDFEASAMPTQDGLRLNHLGALSRLGQSLVIHIGSTRSLPRSRRRGGARRKAMLN